MSMAACPTYWERVLPGTSEWAKASAQKQQQIESALAPDAKPDEIQKQHTSPDDPCDMKRFIFNDALRGAEDISELGNLASSKQDSNEQNYETIMASIDSHVEELGVLKLVEFAATLQKKQDHAQEKIVADSVSLEQLVSIDSTKRKGRDEVLAAVHGAAFVQTAQADAKAKMYKQVRNDRIDKRMQTAINQSETLFNDSESLPKLKQAQSIRQQVLDTEARADEMHQEADKATGTEDTIGSITSDLERKQQAGLQQLAACKQEKTRVVAKLDDKRNRLRDALQQLKKVDAEYTDAHIENELLRLKVVSLEVSLESIKSRKADALGASALAVEACAQWREQALTHEANLRTHIAVEATNCQENIMKPIRVASYNIMLAQKLLANVSQDNDGQMSSISGAIEAKMDEQQRLQNEMDSEEPERDIDDVQSELAIAIDENASLQRSLDKAQQTQSQLQSATQTAQNKFDAALQFYVDESIDEQDRANANSLADNLYKNFKLWIKGKARQSSDLASSSVPSTNQGTLVTIDQNMKAWIEKMIDQKAEEKAQQKFEQFKADQLFRSSPSTAAPSEISDS